MLGRARWLYRAWMAFGGGWRRALVEAARVAASVQTRRSCSVLQLANAPLNSAARAWRDGRDGRWASVLAVACKEGRRPSK